MTSKFVHRHRYRALGLAWVLCVPLGCHTTIQTPLTSDGQGTRAGDARLDHGYGTLLALLADEARVEQILAIKSPAEGIAALLRRISTQAREDRRRLESILTDPPVVDATETGLGVIERDVRSRIAGRETSALIFAGGERFERRILLTQDKATSYAAALAASLSRADPQSSRREVLGVMSREWEDLGDEVRGWLEVRDQTEDGSGSSGAGITRTPAGL